MKSKYIWAETQAEILQLPLVQLLCKVSAVHMHSLSGKIRMKSPGEEKSSSLADIKYPFKHVYHIYHHHHLQVETEIL